MLKSKGADMQNNIINNIRLDINNETQKSSISIRKGDTKTRVIHIVMTNASAVVSLEHALIAIVLIKKPDGTELYNDCVISGNEIQYTITSQTISAEGICECQVQISFDDESLITSPKFNIIVYNPVLDSRVIESTNEYTSALALLAQTRTNAQNASASATMAQTYANSVEQSATNASYSAQSAESSATSAQSYASSASASADNAAISETNAATSETNAETYKNQAMGYAESAEGYKDSAESAKDLASGYAQDASNEADRASGYRESMEDNVDACEISEANALQSASDASDYATYSESYAIGGTGTRTGEETDNAKYYKEECQRIAGAIGSPLSPAGTITFAQLASVTLTVGFMYNITDDFTSDARFEDGGGIEYGAGTNVYVTNNNKLDCLQGRSQSVNNKTGNDITLYGSDINIPNYTKATLKSNIAATDTVTQALGKLEKKSDDALLDTTNLASNLSSALSRITSLEGRMTNTEGTISTHTSSLNSLDGRLDTIEATYGYPFTPEEGEE